jgi:hypothetical protein
MNRLNYFSAEIHCSEQTDTRLLINDSVKNDLLKGVEFLSTELGSVGLPLTQRSATRFLSVLKADRFNEYKSSLQDIHTRIHDELPAIELLIIPAAQVPYYVSAGEWIGPDVTAKFPSVSMEAEEASKCYALCRSTACVFHLMRILEIGLNSLAHSLSVSFQRRNWENIIGDIEAEIRNIGPTRGPSWKDEEQFYAGAALQFRYFKNAWRNHVMHIRDVYSQDKSHEIMNHVQEFMNHLATRIEEVPLT